MQTVTLSSVPQQIAFRGAVLGIVALIFWFLIFRPHKSKKTGIDDPAGPENPSARKSVI